jgi:hypothetical protein
MVGIAGEARAQAVYVPNQWEDRPNTEIAGTIGLTSIFGPGPAGVRVTRRVTPWVDIEAGADRQREWWVGPPNRLITAGVRLSMPFELRSRRPHSIAEGPGSLFVTLGAARAMGMAWRVSPMISVGAQSPWAAKVLALRCEYQRFTRGRVPHYDQSRLMLSAVVGLRL